MTAMIALVHPAQGATLSDSISQALATHPQVDAGKASRAAADKAVWEQKAGYFPTVGASARAGRIHQNDDTTRGATGDDAYSWLGEGTVTLNQPIFAGFSVYNRHLAAQDRRAVADSDLETAGENIALRAARAHLNLMRTQELLDIASSYFEAIQQRKDSIDLMVKEGAADEAEQLQADEILMLAKTTRLGYEEAFRQAEADYIEVVGAPPGETLEFGEKEWDGMIPATLEDAAGRATKDNPQLQGADTLIKALSHETKAEKGTMMPRVDGELSYTEKDQDDDLGGELMSAQAMLKMSWEFSTGGAQLARVDKGRELENEARARRADLLRTVEHDVRQKFTSMQVVDEQFGLFVDREQASQKILDNFTTQFEGGKQSNLQLISANARLFEARAARTDAYYRRLLSRFELLNAMGTLRNAFGPVRAASAVMTPVVAGQADAKAVSGASSPAAIQWTGDKQVQEMPAAPVETAPSEKAIRDDITK